MFGFSISFDNGNKGDRAMSEKEQLLTKLIGKKIREKRYELSLIQDELAFGLGLHVKNLSNIERGKNLPGGKTNIRLITNYGIDMTKLIQEAYDELLQQFPDEE